ncbi:anthranilate synthase component I [Aerosakkonema sp. BLCC-F183]|uniref:anthranilate synthase component I n=1 Tax=Aerosakkonema sp. BLCC-F183 TaxID=3342834 RepID=UPI0035B889FD
MMIRAVQPWYWRSLPLEGKTGSAVFAALFLGNNAIATLLESPSIPSTQNNLARYSICAGSPRILNGKLQLWTPAIGEILPFLRNLLSSPPPHSPTPPLPFTGGWLGWLGYDLAWEIEHLPKYRSDSLPFPVAYWYEPECFAVLDHWEQSLWLAASEPAQLDFLQNQLESDLERAGESKVKSQKSKVKSQNSASSLFPLPAPSPTSPQFSISQADYEDTVRQAKKYIQAGDIFQANLSVRFEARTTASSWSIYRALQEINPSPFASYWQTPWGALISCSPERLVKLEERQAQTRPIAGTRSRSSDPTQDRRQAEDLLANRKENAEHIMLVDLERNDLGRVCQWGSVVVDELLTIERYSHVMHLVSNIVGTLRSDCDSVDLIRAMFPGGTITGCPKVRCMEIIEELEPVRRSLFYGSCGYLDRRGHLDLNILIRTLLFSSPAFPPSPSAPVNTVWGQVGAGIVADSDPEKEWYESLDKAQAQLAALSHAEIPM